MDPNHSKDYQFDSNETDLLKYLLDFFQRYKKIFQNAAIVSILFSVLTLLITPNEYTSKAMLKMQDNLKEKMSNNPLGNVSSTFAFGLLGQSADRANFAVEKLKSIDLMTYTLEKYQLTDEVYASRGMSSDGKILYDNRFDPENNTWRRGLPNISEVHRKFKKDFIVRLDPQTGFIEISYEHHSKYFAAEMISRMVQSLNDLTREEDSQTAKESISFLNAELIDAKNERYIDTLSRLIEEQLNKVMLTEVNQNYLIDYIDNPFIPMRKSSPSTITLIFLNLIFFWLLALLYIYFNLERYYLLIRGKVKELSIFKNK